MLTVSVAVHNPDAKMFYRMLESLRKYTPELELLIIIDNASDDINEVTRTITSAMQDIDKVFIVRNEKNAGFGEAHNQSLKLCKTEYFAVLNDDIEFFENWSTPMIAVLADEQVGQVGIKGGQFNYANANGNVGIIDTNEPEYIEASCMMMRTELAEQFGLFDEAYEFAYFEDHDLSLRLRKHGYLLKNVDVKWIHYRAKTSSKNPVDIEGYHVKNERTFKERWQGYLATKQFKPFIVVKRGGAYGDVFLLEPVIEAIRQKYNCAVAIMSQCPEVIINSPNIDGHITYNYPSKCNMLIDFDYSYELDFRRHIIDAYAASADVDVVKKTGTVYTSEQDMKRVAKILGDDSGFVTVDLSDTWGAKMWALHNYREVIAHLKAQGKRVYGIGKTERLLLNMGLDKNFINQFTIMETAELMKRSSLHLTHEGLTGHFAQALNIPHVIVYGCTSPEYVSDTSLETWRGVVSPVACQGCRHVHAAGCGIICRRDYECVKQIRVEEVIKAIESLDRIIVSGAVCA